MGRVILYRAALALVLSLSLSLSPLSRDELAVLLDTSFQ